MKYGMNFSYFSIILNKFLYVVYNLEASLDRVPLQKYSQEPAKNFVMHFLLSYQRRLIFGVCVNMRKVSGHG